MARKSSGRLTEAGSVAPDGERERGQITETGLRATGVRGAITLVLGAVVAAGWWRTSTVMAVAISGLGAAWILLYILPATFVRGRDLSPRDRVTAESEARSSLLQAAGGIALVLGVLFTFRQYQLSQSVQITDRFSRAIDQLGSTRLDVRLGGIYSLERLANDSSGDEPTIVAVLSAFVRTEPQARRSSRLSADRQAAFTVLIRRYPAPQPLPTLDLSFARLHAAEAPRADLRGADLSAADLSLADLADADLRRADLSTANLRGADVSGADFSGADLSGADLVGVLCDQRTAWPPATVVSCRVP